MINDANILSAIDLLSDWAKWLITIETAAITMIGSLSRSLPAIKHSTKKYNNIDYWRILATITILFFLASIASAAFLLLSLPEIALIDKSNQVRTIKVASMTENPGFDRAKSS